jgi:hypothetical protein
VGKRLRSRQEWSEIVMKWKCSGLSVREFCLTEGICERRLYEMRKLLADSKRNYELNFDKSPVVKEYLIF